jgi:hypothetical protein
VLLTRTPLYSRSCPRFLVRLACVRHAASVDSEPGSNSRLKSAHAQSTEALHANSVSSPASETGRRFTRPVPCRRNQARRSALRDARVSAEPETGPTLPKRTQLTWLAQLSCQRTRYSEGFAAEPPKSGFEARPAWSTTGRLPDQKSVIGQFPTLPKQNYPCQEGSKILFQPDASGEMLILADQTIANLSFCVKRKIAPEKRADSARLPARRSALFRCPQANRKNTSRKYSFSEFPDSPRFHF